MYVCVLYHDVTDWERFDALGADLPHAPGESAMLGYFPARDHRSAVAIWRTEDLDALRGWLDARTAGLSRNDWIEIDEVRAMGLPKIAAHA